MHWDKLKVWDKSHQLVLDIYKITAAFPKAELYALTSQIRRSALSVPANIVEGQSRNTTKEYHQFLFNARGSLEETRYYLRVARDLEYITEKEYSGLESRYEEVSRMLNSLIQSIKKMSK
ncbi:MAG: four helix bundle protein [Nitrospirota bacterium]|nr:four helix bundle protein [Nitrospirota bacterium]